MKFPEPDIPGPDITRAARNGPSRQAFALFGTSRDRRLPAQDLRDLAGDDGGRPLRNIRQMAKMPEDERPRTDSLMDLVGQRAGATPWDRTPWGQREGAAGSPSKLYWTQCVVFEGDAAAVSRFSVAGYVTTRAPSRPSRAAAALRFGGLVLIAAAVAGAAGYLAGGSSLTAVVPVAAPSQPRASSAGTGHSRADPSAPGLSQANPSEAGPSRAEPSRIGPSGAVPAAPPLDPWPPEQAEVDLAPASPLPAASAVAPSGLPASGSPLPQDPSEITARLKIGIDLMVDGDITAARPILERVAEAGDAGGAFALAETYDPMVLRRLHLQGGIAGDTATARRWYEKARDLGSDAALERLQRLTQDGAVGRRPL